MFSLLWFLVGILSGVLLAELWIEIEDYSDRKRPGNKKE